MKEIETLNMLVNTIKKHEKTNFNIEQVKYWTKTRCKQIKTSNISTTNCQEEYNWTTNPPGTTTTTETKKLISDKDDAFARAKTTKNEDDIRHYNHIRNKVRFFLKDKKNLTKKILKEINGNPKKQWQSVKKISGWNKFSNPSMVVEDGKTKTSNKDIADSLNYNFIKKNITLYRDIPKSQISPLVNYKNQICH